MALIAELIIEISGLKQTHSRLGVDLVPCQACLVLVAGCSFGWEELRLREPDEASRAAIAETFTALEFVQHARRLDLVWASLFPRPRAALR